MASGRERYKLSGHVQPITALAFGRGNSSIFSASQDGTVKEWDLHGGSKIKEITVSRPVMNGGVNDPSIFIDDGVASIAVSPDGKYLIEDHHIDSSGCQMPAIIWDLDTGKPQTHLPCYIKRPFLFFSSNNIIALMVKNLHDHREISQVQVLLSVNGKIAPLYNYSTFMRPTVLGFSNLDQKAYYLGTDSSYSEAGTFELDFQQAAFSHLFPENIHEISGDGELGFSFSDRSGWGSPDIEVRMYDLAHRAKIRTMKLSSTLTDIVDNKPARIHLTNISASYNGGLLVTSSKPSSFGPISAFVSVWETTSGKEFRVTHPEWKETTNRSLESLIGCLSPDNNILATLEIVFDSKDLILRTWDWRKSKELSTTKLMVHYAQPRETRNFQCSKDIAFAPNGDEIAVRHEMILSSSNEIFDSDTYVNLVSIFSSHGMTNNNRRYLGPRFGSNYGDFSVFWPHLGKRVIAVGRKLSGSLDRFTGEPIVALVDPVSKMSTTFIISGSETQSAVSSTGERIAVGPTIWDANTQKPLVTLAAFAKGSEWVAITPEGYYNSSEHGHQYINMRRGNEVYGAEQLYDVFYRPDLVIKKLRGEDIRGDGKLLTIDEALANPPPVAEILGLAPKGNEGMQEVSFRLQGKGGGIGEVRLFHNRKLVHRLDAKLAGAASYEGKVTVQGVAGDNEVTVMGMNQQNSVQGMMRSQGFSVAGAGKRPRAYVLAVGIGQYRAGKDALPFAVSDARQMAVSLQKGLGTLYPPEDVQVEVIADSQATRQGILDHFERLKAVVQPGDQFVLFFASHGLLSNGKYYVVTHDFDGAFDPAKGLSSEELMEASREIRALHQLLIFDTCHAGGMDQTVTATYDARMSVLARQMGLHVFAAASPLEKAVEGYQGRGLFTHTLLEGLSRGPSVDADHDQTVTVKELGEYVKGKMNEIQQEIGLRQTPRILNVGQDKGLYRVGGSAVVPTTTLAAVTQAPIPPPATKGLMINTGAGVSLRSTPSRSASKRLLLSFGQVVTLMERQTQSDETWCRVSTAEGGEGWIPINFLADFQREKAPSTYARIAREKLAATSQFGDLVEVGNFLSNMETSVQEGRDASELKALRLQAFRKTYAAIPPSGRNDSPYREWIQEHQGQPGWGEITRP